MNNTNIEKITELKDKIDTLSLEKKDYLKNPLDYKMQLIKEKLIVKYKWLIEATKDLISLSKLNNNQIKHYKFNNIILSIVKTGKEFYEVNMFFYLSDNGFEVKKKNVIFTINIDKDYINDVFTRYFVEDLHGNTVSVNEIYSYKVYGFMEHIQLNNVMNAINEDKIISKEEKNTILTNIEELKNIKLQKLREEYNLLSDELSEKRLFSDIYYPEKKSLL